MEKAYICVDIGGTKTAFAIFGTDRKEYFYKSIPTRAYEGAEALLDRVFDSLKDAMHLYTICGGVVAAPGPLNSETGVLLNLVTLGWKNIPVVEMFQQKFGIPFSLMNDCDAGALGVAEEFGFLNEGTLCYMSISTGIGGGTVTHGEILNGAGNASDFGHIPVVGEGIKCGCGKTDCLELYASGSGIENCYKRKTGNILECAEIARLAREKNNIAAKIFADAGKYLIYAVNIIKAVVDPDILVFGGSVCKAADLLFSEMEQIGCKTVFTSANGKQVLYGAYLLAEKNYGDKSI